MAWEGVSVGTVAQADVVPSVDEDRDGQPASVARIAPVARAPRRREEIESVPTPLLAAILAQLKMTSTSAGEGVPAWLAEAVGDPLTYDAASPHRIDVCARVDPTLYRRLQAMKERLGLRTTAGAWEYVLRAGLATSTRRVRCAVDARKEVRDGAPDGERRSDNRAGVVKRKPVKTQ